MAMPLGKKISGGYATVKDGGDYRKIAEELTRRGFKMNHSSARNYFLAAMKSIAEDILRAGGKSPTDEEVSELAKAPLFQSAIHDMYERHLEE